MRQEEKKRRRTNLSDICNTYFDYEEDSAPRYSMPTNQMQGGGPAGYVSDQSDGEEGEGDGDLNYSDDETGTGPLLPPSNEPRLQPSSGLEIEREGADRNESESGSNSNTGDQPRRLNTEFKVHSTLKKRCSVSWSSPHTDTHTAKEQSASRERDRESVRKREKEMESIRDIDKEREREREKDPIPGAKGGRGYGSRGESKGEGEGKAVGFRFEGDSWDRSTFGELRRKYSEGHSQRERDKEKEKERTGHADRDGEKGEEKHSGRVTIETELSEVEIEVEVEAAGVCEEADSAPDSIPSPHRLSTLPSPPHLPLLYKPRRSVDTTSHRTSLGSQGSSSSNSSRHMRQFRKTSKGSLSFSRSPRHIPVIVPRQSLLSTSLPTSVPLSSAQGRNNGESSDSDSASESGSDSDSDSDFNMATSVPPVGAVLPPTLRPFHTTRTSLSLSHSKKRSSPSKVNRHSSFLPSYTILSYHPYPVLRCDVLYCPVLC